MFKYFNKMKLFIGNNCNLENIRLTQILQWETSINFHALSISISNNDNNNK